MDLNNAPAALKLLTKKNDLENLLYTIKNDKKYVLKIVKPYEFICGEYTITTIEDCSIIIPYFEEQLEKINKQLINM